AGLIAAPLEDRQLARLLGDVGTLAQRRRLGRRTRAACTRVRRRSAPSEQGGAAERRARRQEITSVHLLHVTSPPRFDPPARGLMPAPFRPPSPPAAHRCRPAPATRPPAGADEPRPPAHTRYRPRSGPAPGPARHRA